MKCIIPLAIITCLLNSSLQSMHTRQIPVLSLESRQKIKAFMMQQAASNAAENLLRELMRRPQAYQNADRITINTHHNNTMIEITLSLFTNREEEPLETTQYMSSEQFHAIIDDRVKSDSCCFC